MCVKVHFLYEILHLNHQMEFYTTSSTKGHLIRSNSSSWCPIVPHGHSTLVFSTNFCSSDYLFSRFHETKFQINLSLGENIETRQITFKIRVKVFILFSQNKHKTKHCNYTLNSIHHFLFPSNTTTIHRPSPFPRRFAIVN